jgi:hypothetical protein
MKESASRTTFHQVDARAELAEELVGFKEDVLGYELIFFPLVVFGVV